MTCFRKTRKVADKDDRGEGALFGRGSIKGLLVSGGNTVYYGTDDQNSKSHDHQQLEVNSLRRSGKS